MKALKFRKKPVVVEAIHYTWNGTPLVPQEVQDRVADFMGCNVEVYDGKIEILTLEGTLTASPGDWIIKGVAGEFYPCKPEIFYASYEPDIDPHVVEERDPRIAIELEIIRRPSNAPPKELLLQRAALDVVAERQRQVEMEGFSPRKDDRYLDGDLAWAGACYAVAGGYPNPASNVIGMKAIPHALWPWALESFKPKDRRTDLVRAAALIIAEIERLDRASEKAQQQGETA